MNIIKKSQELYKNDSGTICVYEAESVEQHELCYCIEHIPSGHMSIFDHEPAVLDAVMTRISSSGIGYEHGFQLKKSAGIQGLCMAKEVR